MIRVDQLKSCSTCEGGAQQLNAFHRLRIPPLEQFRGGSVGRTMFNRSQILVSLLAALLAGCRKIEMVSMEGMP